MTAADTAADIATSETSVTPLPSSTPASRGVDSRRISEFLDAFEAAPDAAADAELAERLAHLALPPCTGSAAESLMTDAFVCMADEGPIAELRAEQCPDDSGDWLLTLTEREAEEPIGVEYGRFPRGPVTPRLAPGGGWRTSAQGGLPTAVSGGWTDPDTLRVDVLFLETPHRMYVTCDIPRATIEAHFVTEWLANGPVTRLRAPLER